MKKNKSPYKILLEFYTGDLFLYWSSVFFCIGDVDAFTSRHVGSDVRSPGNIPERELHFSWRRYHIFTFFARGVAASVKEIQFDRGHVYLFAIYFSLSRLPTEKWHFSRFLLSPPPLSLSLSRFVSLFSRSFIIPAFRFDRRSRKPFNVQVS